MSQVDEGLIHAWLDGQLSAEDAARVALLVETRADWGAAAAEARGLVAGASRILSALDHVPSVNGARSARPVSRRSGWRASAWISAAAAAVLVAGIGTFVWPRVSHDAAPVQRNDRPVPALRPEAPAVTERPVAVKPPAKAGSGGRSEEKLVAIPKRPQSSRLVADSGGAHATNAMLLKGEGDLDGSCWASAPGAGERSADANVQLKTGGATILRLAQATVTDVAGSSRSAVRAVAGAVAAPPATAAAIAAPVQNAAFSRRDDSTYVAEWIASDGRTDLTFSVQRDTLRGTALRTSGDLHYAPRSFLATRVPCR